MADPRFERCVILIVDHSDESAMGLVVNKVVGEMQIGKKEPDDDAPKPNPLPVYYGGPVNTDRVIIVHSGGDGDYPSTWSVGDEFYVSGNPKILDDYCFGVGPRSMFLVLGYAGWGPGQLEHELQENAWLICNGDTNLVFDTENNLKWEAALRSIGIDPSRLSSVGGSA